jgi:glucosyl-dolichyl phosphate glucuronosyltransferase
MKSPNPTKEVCVNLDVVVPTYNRSQLLKRTIDSVLQANIPPGLNINLVIVDNNCKDNTAEVVREYQSQQTSIPIVYIKETRQGLSNARNGGIAGTTSEIVAFIDDDEEIDKHWLEVIVREFADPETHFIGGPYLPNWQAPRPSWLPPGYHSAIGVVDPKPRTVFSPEFGANLMGGNAVIRRSVFDRIGTYSPKLGRSGKGLLSDEDSEFYRRLMRAGIRGLHVPDLIIYHHIPAERLTRKYHRSWCYWRGVSQGLADRDVQETVSYSFGVPRYRIGRAIKGLASMPGSYLSGNNGQGFAWELTLWDLAGFIYGKHFINIDSYYADQKK